MNKQFFLYLLRLYGGGMALLTMLRVAFFVYFFSHIKIAAASEIGMSFAVGMLMDSNAVATTLLLCYLVCLPVRFFTVNYIRLFFYLFNILINLVLFVNLIDIFYFKQYGTRVNMLATEAFNHYDIVLPMLYEEYPLIRVLLVAALIAFLFVRWHGKKLVAPETAKTSKKGLWVAACILTFGALTFLYYGPPLWKLTSFSNSSTLNQMSSNGAYSFLKSFHQHQIYEDDITAFKDVSDSAAFLAVQDVVVHGDEKQVDPFFLTLRRPLETVKGPPKNIVIIIVESFSASNIGVLGGRKLSPRFDSWSSKGLLFTHCYANGPRTQNGLTSVLTGFPSILGESLIRRKGLNEFHSIANILESQGYATQFIHNGDVHFDDMDLLLNQGGFQDMIDVTDFQQWKYKNSWGVCDEDLFDKAYPMIWNDHDKPKLSVLLTMSNHAPHQAPPYFVASHPEVKDMKDPAFETFYYTDYAIGKFLDKCAQHPQFKNTLFLIIADHGEAYTPEDHEFKVFHIPALLLNTSKGNGRFEGVCSQVDFPATLMHESGISHPYHFIGQNLFSKDFTPFSISRYSSPGLFFRTGDQMLYYDFLSDKTDLFQVKENSHLNHTCIKDPARSDSLKRFSKNYLQGISLIYTQGRYQFRKPE